MLPWLRRAQRFFGFGEGQVVDVAVHDDFAGARRDHRRFGVCLPCGARAGVEQLRSAGEWAIHDELAVGVDVSVGGADRDLDLAVVLDDGGRTAGDAADGVAH